MREQLQPEEARQALDEVRARQEQVIEAVLVPNWYWWTVGASMVVMSAVVDTHRTLATAVAISAFVCIVVVLSVRLIFGAYRHVRVNRYLLGDRGAVSIVAFVWLLVGGTLAVGFGLQAAGVGHPATIGSLVGAAGLVAGGPLLMRRLRAIMIASRTGQIRG